MSSAKRWGNAPFWGVSEDFDPQWTLDEEQKRVQQKLIDLCRTTLRPNAVVSDETYEYPRKNLDALASVGLLGLIVPKEMGGLGQNHVGAAMVVETIARYGCPSTAMVYVMHISSVATLLLRYHDNPTIQSLLKRLDKDKLVGTLCYSDPTTGGHFWYPLSSRTKYHKEGDCVQMLKYGSWATSAGFADFYCVQTVSPDFGGDYSNLSVFLVYQDEVRADTSDWSALGMHGNQSGPIICETTLTKDRVVGPFGDGSASNDECVDTYFLTFSSCCWNGISLGCLDIAKKHVTTKQHADVGMRIADYPTIKDYIGEAMIETNACRLMVLNVAQGMDKETQNNNWSLHSDPGFLPRSKFLHWCWQLKFACAKNVTLVTDKMLHTCGGTGYKTDLGIERLLRDGKAAWVMGPSNEVLRQFVGSSILFGLDALDYWVQKPNPRVLNSELKKMTNDQKVSLAQKILKEVAMNDPTKTKLYTYQDSEFDNPFNTRPPATVGTYKTPDGVEHAPALSPDKFTEVKLVSVKHFTDKLAMFDFALPHPSDHTGCLPGQYVQVRVDRSGKPCQRYFSPVTGTKEFGKIGLVIRFESHGQFSICLKNLKPGASVMMKAPCGGFEYIPNSINHLSLLASGGGVTPCVQLLRDIIKNSDDKTRVSLLYYAEKEADFLFKDELDTYVSQDERLKVFYSIKDGAEFENWKGGDGYLNDKMIKAHLPPASETSHKILVCGGPSMIITVLQYMLEIGYRSEDVFVYGQFGAEQVRSIYGQNAKISTHRVQ